MVKAMDHQKIVFGDYENLMAERIHTYIHTTKFIERQNREERIGGAGIRVTVIGQLYSALLWDESIARDTQL